MPTAIEVRSRFRRFAGDARFARFIAAVHGFAGYRGRLRHWQEQLWTDFISANPDCSMTHDELCAVFRICELHGCDLQSKRVPVVEGCVDFAPEYIHDRIERFPHASPDVVSTEGRPKQSNWESIWYCATCDGVRENTRWRTLKTARND